ncbi:unnamed protein product [Chrysodeixis includens]|uniref:Uncharacterized protein n=1 Tax=Chrysodeixis includens TaxID=689277 RepID=A0A9P0BNB4_CHRIL|nr:unnamed protein product [Chrysodeixis includens]
MGPLYSIQVYEGVTLLVMCLIKLVVTERNYVFLLANLAFMVSIIILTGAYMIPAGDITHEASEVSTSMFHSGWELHGGADLRTLAVVALQVSQVPVYMTAYGVIVLSHRNLVSVSFGLNTSLSEKLRG